jgi:diguanylate cyclase (GGDEF)-like protein
MNSAESIPTRAAAPAATAGTRTAFTALRTSTVMMVDDDPLMLEVVQTYLEEAGYVSFITTSQPKEAMGLFVQHRPDILLLDLMMPEVSGFDILAEVRGHEELRYTPVIILTAESDPAAKLKALELGATDLLTKPVDPSELRLRLRNALAFKAYQDRLVDTDPLTGLPNRKKFRLEVEAALARSAAQSSRACTLLHIDLDRFKQVNDSLGHRVGDRLLCAAARVLETVFSSFKPSQSTGREVSVAFSRIGGNGFGVLLPDLHNLTKVDEATAMARRIQNALSEPFDVDGHKLRTSASIGIAVSPGDGEDADALLKNAEVAMYQAKQRGRKTYTFFSNEMNAEGGDRHPQDYGRRGIAALATSGTGDLVARQIHSHRRRDRTDRGDRPMGAAHGVRSGRGLASAGPAAFVRLGQRGGAAVQERGHLARGARCRGAQQDPAAAPSAGADREHADGRRRRDHLHPVRDQGDGGSPVGGRFRHRLLIAHLPEPVPHR